MTNGTVNADLEAVIRLLVRGPAAQRRKIKAVIDTGYNGWLTLPPVLIAALGLPWRRRSRAVLADGNETLFDIYEATVIWDRRRFLVPIDEADTTPLVGTALMEGYDFSMQV